MAGKVMETSNLVLILATILMAAGLWWALPWGKQRKRSPGWALLAAGLAMIGALIPPVGSFLARSLITLMAIITVASAAAMITTTRPLYAALWFGMAVLGTAGMLLYNGAEFVAMAVIVIYIGAILVMFLFLLMLDNSKGMAAFDRESWEPLTSAIVGAVLISLSTATWLHRTSISGRTACAEEGDKVSPVVVTQTVDLGHELFSRYGVAVQVLGLILLLALIGAAIIISRPLEPLSDLKDHRETTHAAGDVDSTS
jgi:NADH-quinone oxidoreductase subunit J